MNTTRPTRSIACPCCGHGFDVSERALSLRCPRCTTPLAIGDVCLRTGVCAAAIRAVGRVMIERAARFCGRHMVATAGLIVDGSIESEAWCGGTVRLGPAARWKGSCRAPALIVEEGAVIEGGYFAVGPARPQGAHR
jgi:hypothetical protein